MEFSEGGLELDFDQNLCMCERKRERERERSIFATIEGKMEEVSEMCNRTRHSIRTSKVLSWAPPPQIRLSSAHPGLSDCFPSSFFVI